MSDINHEHEHDMELKKSLRPEIKRDNKYWMSIEHFEQNPEFMKKAEEEFQSSPLREGEAEDGVARREFMKLMGASIALASAGCIRRPVQKIVPYAQMPEEVTLGIPNWYTSAYFDGNEALGLLVKTREGRPIFVAGNPSHPLSQGGMSARAHGVVLNLYDPERLQAPRKNLFNEKRTNKDTVNTTWEDMDKAVSAQLKKGGVAVLTPSLASPSTRAVVADFCQAFNANHISWDALSTEDIRQGQKAAYGDAVVPAYRYDKAKMIVSVDADFLGTWLNTTASAKQFSAGRKNIEQMNRLVAFDSGFSLTGANADTRIRIKPSQQLDVVMGLLHEIIVAKGFSSYAGNAAVKSLLTGWAGSAARLNIEPALFSQIAFDLWENKSKALVVAGGPTAMTSSAFELQMAVKLLNSALDADGNTVEGKNGISGFKGGYVELAGLVKDMAAGKVKTLIIHRSNPIYALPKDFGFADSLKKVEMVIYTGDRMDETGSWANYLAPDNHLLESWGDAELVSGVFSIQQPAIRPMYDTRSFQLSLMTWAYIAKQGSKRLVEYETFYDYLRAFWRSDVFPKNSNGKSFDDFWIEALQNGVVGNAKKDSSARSLNSGAVVTALNGKKPSTTSKGMELVLHAKVAIGDGSMANVAWLHELPDPVTKIAWDNYASISIKTAKDSKISEGDILLVSVNGLSLEIPAHIQPGLHDDVVAISLGYGRTMAGKVGNGIGQNAYQFAELKNGTMVFSGGDVKFAKTGKSTTLACPQGHHQMEGRQIVVEATLKDYLKKKDANIHRHHIWSMWSGHQYNGHKWGMALDLNSCTGCNACVVACQSENNIPVVGRRYMIEGREMHWIRIDRYYSGTLENPAVVFQPVMCQHCDNAPCETVCPVIATAHSDEGLNDMAYNRCVGTRYCANNCPYKVRRFNWFHWNKEIEKPLNMALNPEVTVRFRGVMEKCSFCVQRIKEGKNKAKLENRALKDGEIKTACQSSCPSDAIVFGDMNDPESQLSKQFKNERSYSLLEEWNAAPAVRYMSKIRNNHQETANNHADHKEGGHV